MWRETAKFFFFFAWEKKQADVYVTEKFAPSPLARVSNFGHYVPPTRMTSGRYLATQDRISRIAEWKRLAPSWRVHISSMRSPKNSIDLVLPAFLQSRKVMGGDHVVRYRGENIRHNMEEERMQSQECICDEYDNFIKPVRMVSKLISIWPLEKDHTAKASFFKNCHLIGLFFVVCTF